MSIFVSYSKNFSTYAYQWVFNIKYSMGILSIYISCFAEDNWLIFLMERRMCLMQLYPAIDLSLPFDLSWNSFHILTSFFFDVVKLYVKFLTGWSKNFQDRRFICIKIFEIFGCLLGVLDGVLHYLQYLSDVSYFKNIILFSAFYAWGWDFSFLIHMYMYISAT